ncbi:peptidase S9, prolyl oligopeptidase active site domain protein [Acidothermus cellulolyticus 11B]|uniref:Peptidase S9, prolyl oligopeptidase active site domain protein n=1 Tax=Acidothermus cellulolyticus (strain ATCC 43068 / DSM 8971 / 11B) TaxID=351607 RepID=A0LUR8_ACIC1|nr:S9 family peptidase [Acidothermus cellulolyticus]ABK53178.1 peptidase S9, prolyl oligopeptidase active site domain protein [Acidothermus cellulolyticus 11B]
MPAQLPPDGEVRAKPTDSDAAHPFADLDRYVAIPRVAGLILAPDGRRLVCVVQTPAADNSAYVSALWEVDPAGEAPPRRLTFSAEGETQPAFTADGDLLFVSKRSSPSPSPGSAETETTAGLWRLPASGGEAYQVAAPSAGITKVLAARAAGVVLVVAPALPGPYEEDAARRKARREAGVSAVLHESAPVRHWDRDIGPDFPRLLRVDLDGTAVSSAQPVSGRLHDLTPDPGRALDEVGLAVSDDGRIAVCGWRTPLGRGVEGVSLVAIDTTSGERRVLLAATAEPVKQNFDQPAISPDGRYVVCVCEEEGDRDHPPRCSLRLVDLHSGAVTPLAPEFPYWPANPRFSADGSAVFFVADEQGRCPVFRVDIATGQVRRLASDGAYSEVNVSPDGKYLYALRSRIDEPPRPVRLEVDAVDQKPMEIPAPGEILSYPGRVTEITATAVDGVPLRAWLVLPDGATAEHPAPLALWIHGGPLMSWNSWSWRWNPWLLAARGYAVLLPDPGLSQGYGQEFITRAWRDWGPVPFADLMTITDAAAARADIDETRIAAMGGSYGGFMANWIAGHTDRFKAIVSHASLWALDYFTGVTDHAGEWLREWGHPVHEPERYERNSPHRHIAAIRTPMLVIHGDKDYRVPIAEGLKLWADLVWHGCDAKFLYFPDENHWILKPGNVKAWYATVLAFLDHYVRGLPWRRPELV